jgi:hypothetical protein
MNLTLETHQSRALSVLIAGEMLPQSLVKRDVHHLQEVWHLYYGVSAWLLTHDM